METTGGTTWRYELGLCAVFAASLVASSIHAFDLFTWFLEVLPALIGVAVLAATRRRFRFTPLVYTLILIHSIAGSQGWKGANLISPVLCQVAQTTRARTRAEGA